MVNAYIENSYKLVFPILCNGYLNLDYDIPVTHTSAAQEASGVLVNGAVNDNSTTTIAVDTVDATTKFSVGDTVYDNAGASVGIVSAVTATQITLAANNDEALGDNENLKRNLSTTEILRNRSLWAHDDSFTIEAIVTPYDVNGVGSRKTNTHGILTSEKTPPYPYDGVSSRDTTYDSVFYLGEQSDAEDGNASTKSYLNQKMMLFHNTNLKLYLENTTTSSYNQPAEYRVVAELTNASGTTNTITSDTVIKAEDMLIGYYDSTGYYNNLTTRHRRLSTGATGSNPTGTITINDYTQLHANSRATGQIVVSGDIANYTKPANATGTVTIASQNGFNVDVNPVAEAGSVKFANQPTASDNTNVNNYIQLIGEGGTATSKWFARSSGTNGAALSGNNGTFTWPANAYQYNIGGDIATTAGNFGSAVDNWIGWQGSVGSVRTENNPVVGGNTNQVVDLTSAITGSTPNRLGDSGAALSVGSTFTATNDAGSGNSIGVTQFSGGTNELILGETSGSADSTINYISITDSAGTTKNYFPSETNSTGSTGTRTLDNSSTVSVVYFNWGGVNQNSNCAEALKTAINHSNGHPNTITATRSGAVVTLTHDLIGSAGNNATIAKTNTANSVATISGSNFTGGVTETSASNTPFIQLIDNESSAVTKKYVPVANGGSIANGGTNSGSIGDVSGGVAFQEGGSAAATADNLRTAIAHSNGHNGKILTDSAGSATINLSQFTVGANTTAITLTNLPSNISKTNFSGGGTPDNFIRILDAAGVERKYKASTIETTGTSSGGFVFYKKETNNNTTTTNLETAIDSSSGHNGSLITTRTNNAISVKLNQAAIGSAVITETTDGVTFSNFSTTNTNNVEVGSNEAINIGKGNKIYDSSTTLIGTVASVSGDTITLDATPATAITSTVYTDQRKEALYLEQMYKICLVFLKSGSMELWLNDELLKKQSHSLNSVKVHPSDCKIGRGADNSEQFFGELYEIAMHKGKKPCATKNTLTPGYSDIIFYYSFGE